MDKIDYKKMYSELYMPKAEPSKIIVPPMNFIMVDGKGNPNTPEGEYQQAVELLYAITYTIKMSPKKGISFAGYVEYVVPPLEGLWWLKDESDMDFTKKDKYYWTSMIRQPEFVTDDIFKWACEEVKSKKVHLDVAKARFETFDEGLCVQSMHYGPYDEEPETINKIENYIKNEGLKCAISTVALDGNVRRHHEIYLSDPRKTKPEKMKTVLRHPVRV
jgi:hypothetical protein